MYRRDKHYCNNILYGNFDFIEDFRTRLYSPYSHFHSLSGVNPSLNINYAQCSLLFFFH